MKIKALLFLILTGFACWSQERLGITNSNYSSTNSIYLNPSSSADSWTYMQFNIVGFNAFAMNNAAYLPKFSVAGAIKNGVADPGISTLKFRKFAYATACVDGPAFVISKELYGGGLFIRGRSVANITNVPSRISNFFLKDNTTRAASENFNLKNMHLSNMSWVEYGANFSAIIKRDRNNMVTAGASLRYITGVNIAYVNLDKIQGAFNDTTVSVQNLSGRVRYNTPGWNTGNGAGLDVGFTFKKMLGVVENYFANSKKSNCTYVDYKYKIGISLRDLGYIKFKKQPTKATVKNSSGYFHSASGDSSYANAFVVDFNPSVNYSPILASLPTSLAWQFDWNFENNVFLNVTVVKNLVPNRVTGVQSPNLISICPRFELKQFEVAMPLTFQRFLYPQLGLAFRIRTFVLGFDNVFPLFLKKNTYGLNIYASIGFSIFKNPDCRVRSTHVDYCPPKIKTPKRAKDKHQKRKKFLGIF